MFAAVRRRLRLGAAQHSSPAQLADCDSGATVVEFALVAAPFLALLVALFQSALVFFAGRVLDETVSQAARVIMTKQSQSSSQTNFASYLCSQTFALFTCGNFMINVQNYGSFSAASTTTPTLTFDSHGNVTNNWNYSTGSANDVVVVQVMYQWPIVLGPLGMNLSNLSNGNRLLVSTIAFKNEP